MKSPAPLLSLNPSGTFAGLITASIWKGRNYIRQRVDPSNPRTAGQIQTRFNVGAVAKAAHAVLTSFADIADVGSPFFVAARDQAPSGQSWISFLQKHDPALLQGAISTAFNAMSGTIQNYFDTTATAIGLTNYTFPAGSPGATFGGTPREQLFALAYFASNFLSGSVKTVADTAIAAANQGEVDAFGDVVHSTV